MNDSFGHSGALKGVRSRSASSFGGTKSPSPGALRHCTRSKSPVQRDTMSSPSIG